MIKTVIFDIGNVLMDFDWWPYVRARFGEEVAKEISEAIWSKGYWNEMDRGYYTIDDVIRLASGDCPKYAKEIREAIYGADASMSRHDYAIPWIQELKSLGYQVLYLSNYNFFTMDLKREVLDFIPYTDGGVFSCKVKLIKPDPAIYRYICKEYHLKPEECLFIDDNEDNVQAARACGLHSIRFENYEKNYPQIMQYLTTGDGAVSS